MRQQIQKFGRALSGMVMPNIGAFIAWGFVTALFIPSGWWPNTQMARLVDPMLTYLLPLLIAYTAGRNVAGERGGVIGAIAAMGVIVGSDIPMFIGVMVMGPLGGYTIRWFDKLTQGRIKAGFEMLVSNFSIGILGMLLAILGYWVIGGAVTGLTLLVSNGVEVVIRHGLLPLVSLLVEPSKVLFLNNALNHGIFSPIGIEQARETGQSIMFLLETNPGPGLGVLLACWFFGRGNMRQSAPGAVIIQFFGGIHEIYFPYILARPALILAPVAGSAAGLLFFSLAGAGLVAPASPGSIISVLAMAPKGQTLVVLAGVLISTAAMEDAELVIADEPTPGLDKKTAMGVMDHFRRMADRGAGVLLITHDLELAVRSADRVTVLYGGRTVEETEAFSFLDEGLLKHPYTKALCRSMPGKWPSADALENDREGGVPDEGILEYMRKEYGR